MENIMKTFIFKTSILTILSFSILLAHQKTTHQKIAREAFNLLVKSYPQLATSDMAVYIGNNEITSGHAADGSFGALKIVSGAYLEDEYDAVYGYGLIKDPFYTDYNGIPLPVDAALNFAGYIRASHTSITHFWDADDSNGENAQTTLFDHSDLGWWKFTIPENAMQKIHKYANGEYIFIWAYANNKMSWGDCGTGPDFLHLMTKFDVPGVIEFYKSTGRFQANSFMDINDQWNETDCPGWFQGDILFNKAHAYEILGRMCHLLGDMSVPAHVHCDAHINKIGMTPDYYEENETDYHAWTADEIFNSGQTFINPYNAWSDPLYFLVYLLNQSTDHYASTRSDGDNNYDAACPGLSSIISTLGLPVYTAEVNGANCSAMHDKLYPLAIRATAGLLYWFAIESGLLNGVTIKNDFNANNVQVTLNGSTQSYPSGITLSTINGSALSVSTVTPQDAGGYKRHFREWEKLNKDGSFVSSNSGITWNTTVNGNHTFNARFNKEFNINLLAAQYLEPGTGGTYSINGNNVGSTASTTFIERISTPLTIGANLPANYCFYKWNDGYGASSRTLVPGNHIDLQAAYKAHLASATYGATGLNNQRKIVSDNYGEFHLVYESMGEIWYASSIDRINWTNEVCISDGLGANVNPSIDYYENAEHTILYIDVVWTKTNTKEIIFCQARNQYGYYEWRAREPVESFGSEYINPGTWTPVTSKGWVAYNYSGVNNVGGIRVRFKPVGWRSFLDFPSIWYNHPSVATNPTVDQNTSECYLIFQDASNAAIYYSELHWNGGKIVSTDNEFVSPPDWQSNEYPSVTVIGDEPVVAWQSRHNVVEGGSSVHCRVRPNGAWSNIQSFSYDYFLDLFPSVGTTGSSNGITMIWSQDGNITKSSSGSGGWSAPSIIASGTNAGAFPNIIPLGSTLSSVWRKSNMAIITPEMLPGGHHDEPDLVTGKTNCNTLSKAMGLSSDSSQLGALNYRWNRHGLVRLADVFEKRQDVGGTIAFEIASINHGTEGNRKALRHLNAWDTLARKEHKHVFGSQPFVVGTGEEFTLGGAIYGRNIVIPEDILKSEKEELVSVHLVDAAQGTKLKNIWSVPFSVLSSVKDSVFGAYRDIKLNLASLNGQNIALKIDMLGTSKAIRPVIVDDYFITGGLVKSDSTAAVKKIEERQQTASLPERFALEQCYPNPFNPSTTIAYSLPEPSFATLKLYNTLGEEIRTLVNEFKDAGRYTATTDLSRMPSGVYFYRLTAGRNHDVKRMMLVK